MFKTNSRFNNARRHIIKTGAVAVLSAIAAQSFSILARAYVSKNSELHSVSVGELSKSNANIKSLIGVWSNSNLASCGFNVIALPYPQDEFAYRLLVNQYNESLTFKHIEQNVVNRGFENDQSITAVDYQQDITQIAADEFPRIGEAGGSGLKIHHETGKFLFINNEQSNGFDVARIAAVSHGNSVLALGRVSEVEGAPQIENYSGFPIANGRDINSPSMRPYKHFHEHLFKGVFDPIKPSNYLSSVNENVNITKTTIFSFDSRNKNGGIKSIPFLNKQTKVTEMQSTFYLQELAELDENGDPKLRLQYIQRVMLEFYKSGDGDKLVRWPHISVNTLEKLPLS